eukprot:7379603-Prymnesium_polylepis.2
MAELRKLKRRAGIAEETVRIKKERLDEAEQEYETFPGFLRGPSPPLRALRRRTSFEFGETERRSTVAAGCNGRRSEAGPSDFLEART